MTRSTRYIPNDVILFLRDQLWQSGEISLAGLVRMDQANQWR